jgi:hypothetical protein
MLKYVACYECAKKVLDRVHEDSGSHHQPTIAIEDGLHLIIPEVVEDETHCMIFQSFRVCVLCLRA